MGSQFIFDNYKILRELKPQFDKKKPANTVITAKVDSTGDLNISIDYLIGENAGKNLICFKIDSVGLATMEASKRFSEMVKGNDGEKCVRSIWHSINDIIKKQNTPVDID